MGLLHSGVQLLFHLSRCLIYKRVQRVKWETSPVRFFKYFGRMKDYKCVEITISSWSHASMQVGGFFFKQPQPYPVSSNPIPMYPETADKSGLYEYNALHAPKPITVFFFMFLAFTDTIRTKDKQADGSLLMF